MKDYLKELGSAITICDEDNRIVYMNDKSAETFKKYGGRELIGSDLLDCHPGDSGNKLQELITQEKPNVYMIEKEGVKKLIYQAPLFRNGEYDGFFEISIVLPEEIPLHHRG